MAYLFSYDAYPLIIVHSYLMLKSMLNENLDGILGGNQC
jgi:hypothetical protein